MERYWQLYRLQEIFLQYCSARDTVGYVRQEGRDENRKPKSPNWKNCDPEEVDMVTGGDHR